MLSCCGFAAARGPSFPGVLPPGMLLLCCLLVPAQPCTPVKFSPCVPVPAAAAPLLQPGDPIQLVPVPIQPVPVPQSGLPIHPGPIPHHLQWPWGTSLPRSPQPCACHNHSPSYFPKCSRWGWLWFNKVFNHLLN